MHRPIALALLSLALLAACGRELPAPAEPTPTAPAPAVGIDAVTAIDAPIPPEQIATRLELAQAPRYNAAGDSLELTVRVHNDGQATLVGQGSAMVNLGAMLLGPEGPDAPPGLRDFVRAPLPLMAPGTQAEVAISLPAEPLLGLPVRLELVQEGVNWFANYGQPVLDLGPFQRCQGGAGTLCDADGQALSP